MKLLFLGGTGYLSSVLVQAAIEAGHNVAVLTRGLKGNPRPGVENLVADRDDSEAVRTALGGREFDGVVDAVCFRPEQAKAAVEMFGGKTGHYVMISTDFVYDARNRALPTPESTSRRAASAYGVNKAEAEDVFLATHDRLPVTVLRPPHIAGGDGLLGTGSLEGRDATLTSRLRAGDAVILLDGGALLIQPADRRDIASAALAALNSPAAAGQVYNVAGPKVVTSLRYYEIIAEILGVELNTLSLPSSVFLQVYPDRAPFAVHRYYDTSRLSADTGWKAAVSLEESLGEMVENRLRVECPMKEKSSEMQALVDALVHREGKALTLLKAVG